MVFRTHGHWPLYPATGEQIRQTGAEILSAGRRVTDVREAVRRAHPRVVGATDGYLRDVAMTSLDPVDALFGRVQSATVVAYAALVYFSRAVDRYDTQVSALNRRHFSLTHVFPSSPD